MIPLPKNTIDLTGQTFGRLMVIEYAGREPFSGHALWHCLCVCDAVCVVRGSNLRTGRTVSCGCFRRDPIVRQAARVLTPRWRRKAIAKLKAGARRKPKKMSAA